ncbi:MAG: hypothetical protein JW908_09905 [Anaerolineales bacterium]|nr:hypothetical protein [Anaerolineales bacterium]
MNILQKFSPISFFRYLFATLIVLAVMLQATASAQAGDKASPATTFHPLMSHSPDQQINLIISALAVGLIFMTIYALKRLNRKTND